MSFVEKASEAHQATLAQLSQNPHSFLPPPMELRPAPAPHPTSSSGSGIFSSQEDVVEFLNFNLEPNATASTLAKRRGSIADSQTALRPMDTSEEKDKSSDSALVFGRKFG